MCENKKEIAHYGNITLIRMMCPIYKRKAFVIDGKYSCCGLILKNSNNQEKHIFITPVCFKRKQPHKSTKIDILKLQNNKCIYCGMDFGDSVIRKSRVIVLKAVWDHFVPFAMTANNYPYNFVASCQICNSIKSDKYFNTIEEAIEYVSKKREYERRKEIKMC